ncbi:hypothetical protein F4678DRAFT_452276 [Xylaria arbuscula]|nr:hypothetical protein F4678DRAFT_452276 [Xylaria arbuscula]
MSSFPQFPDLPIELRLEIWRFYFALCHGTQIHIFLSRRSGPQYINQDATTGGPGHNTLAAAGVSADAWAAFKETFYVGDMRDLHSITTGTSTSTSTQNEATQNGKEERNERDKDHRFAISPDDMLYIVDMKVSPVLTALSTTPWFRKAHRIALQVFNFHTPTPNPLRLPVPRPWPDNLDYWGRNWRRWNKLLSDLPPDVWELLASPSLQELFFVVVPNKDIFRDRILKPNVYGFVHIDPLSFTMGSADEVHAVNGHAGLTFLRFCVAFPRQAVHRKVGYVVDAVPARAGFTCVDETLLTDY